MPQHAHQQERDSYGYYSKLSGISACQMPDDRLALGSVYTTKMKTSEEVNGQYHGVD